MNYAEQYTCVEETIIEGLTLYIHKPKGDTIGKGVICIEKTYGISCEICTDIDLRVKSPIQGESMNVAKLHKYIEALKTLKDDGSMTWEIKYDLVFHSKRTAFLNSIGIEDFVWYDPDMGYKDDVRAYIYSFLDEFEDVDFTTASDLLGLYEED